MSSEQLGKLEELAGKRADQSRDQAEREKQQLRQIDQHRHELRAINKEYQQSPVGREDVAPQLLAHRRAFVEQLTQKLDELSIQREQKYRSVQARVHEHQQRAAQHTAIELIHSKRIEERENARARREQQQLDETARGLHYQRKHMEKEQGND